MAEKILILAAVFMLEAEGEKMQGKTAVASTVWNRAVDKKLDGLLKVATSGAYSGYNARRQDLDWQIPEWEKKNSSEWKDCKALAYDMAYGTFQASCNSTHFFSLPQGKFPAWAKELKDVWVLGKHIFGRME